jgi:hypothetical protein
MNTLPRRIAFASFAAVLALAATAARAFTDSNAELREAVADRSARVVITGKAERPVQSAWVPMTAKSLDGFKPVLPEERLVAARNRTPLLAKADVPASARKR